VIKVAEKVAAGEHRLGQRHHHPAEHEPAFALFECRSTVVDGGRDSEQFVELGDQMEARSGSDSTVRCAQHHLALLLRYSGHQTGAFRSGLWGFRNLHYPR
jgi:hypothetical protein